MIFHSLIKFRHIIKQNLQKSTPVLIIGTVFIIVCYHEVGNSTVFIIGLFQKFQNSTYNRTSTYNRYFRVCFKDSKNIFRILEACPLTLCRATSRLLIFWLNSPQGTVLDILFFYDSVFDRFIRLHMQHVWWCVEMFSTKLWEQILGCKCTHCTWLNKAPVT